MGNTDKKTVVALSRIATIVEKGMKRIINIYKRYGQGEETTRKQ